MCALQAGAGTCHTLYYKLYSPPNTAEQEKLTEGKTRRPDLGTRPGLANHTEFSKAAMKAQPGQTHTNTDLSA